MSAATESGESATSPSPASEASEGESSNRDESPSAPSSIAPCANCGHPRDSRFCPKCGQNDRDYIRSLPPLLGDILKETFELDSRIRRTLPPLFLKPGELPTEFSRNRRARYMSPVRLYLVTSIVFFFLLSTLNDFRPRQLDREALEERGAAAVKIEIDKARAADTAALKALLPPQQQRKVDEIIARPGMVFSKMLIAGLATDVGENGATYEDAWVRWLMARSIDVAANPAEVFSAFVENLPLAMFVTLPAYVLLLMLFFLGSRRFFTEHLVFAVQLHTFAFIVLAASMLLPDDGPDGRRGEDERRARVESGILERAKPTAGNPAASPLVATTDNVDRPVPPPPSLAADRPADFDDAAQANIGDDAPDTAPAEDDGPQDIRVQLGPDDDSWDVVDVIDLLLFLWLLAYHYLALRRYYGNGRVRTGLKWAVLTSAYCVLLIPGMALSAAFTVFQLR